MPNISAGPSSAAATVAVKQTERNTHNLEDLLELMWNEVRLLRIDLVDTSSKDEQVR